jgi:Rieske Fe-S protein
MTELTRRSALQGAVVVAVGGVAGYAVTRATVDSGAHRGTDEANAYGAKQSSSGGDSALVALADLPVGGGVIRGDVVITRPSGNAVHAFSAICTHQGCKVDRVADGHIDCPCHGSVFDATTGAVVAGPASSALGAVPVVVRNGEVFRS